MAETEYLNNFIRNYEELCTKSGKKTSVIQNELGLSSSTVSKWRSGIMPSLKYLITLSDYFGVSIDWLLGKRFERKILDDIECEISIKDLLYNMTRTTDNNRDVNFQRAVEYTERMGYPLGAFLRTCTTLNSLDMYGINSLKLQLERYVPKDNKYNHKELYNYYYCICISVDTLINNENLKNFVDMYVKVNPKIWADFLDDIIEDIDTNRELYKDEKFYNINSFSGIADYIKKYDSFHGTNLYNYIEVLNCADTYTIDLQRLKTFLKSMLM